MISVNLFFDLDVGGKVIYCKKETAINFTPLLNMKYYDASLTEAFKLHEDCSVFYVSSIDWLCAEGKDFLAVGLGFVENLRSRIGGIDIDEIVRILRDHNWKAEVDS